MILSKCQLSKLIPLLNPSFFNHIFNFLAEREIFKNDLLVVTGLATLLVLGQLPVLAIKMADSNPSNGTMLISISARKQHGFSGAEEVGLDSLKRRIGGTKVQSGFLRSSPPRLEAAPSNNWLLNTPFGKGKKPPCPCAPVPSTNSPYIPIQRKVKILSSCEKTAK